MHGGKISMELGEKAGEKRRAIVGIGLVLGGGERGKEDGPEESSSRGGGRGVRVGGMTLGRVNEKKGRKRKTWGGVGSEAVTSGQRPPSALCVCARVSGEERPRSYATPRAILLAASPTPRISGENP